MTLTPTAPTLPNFPTPIRHPARYSAALLPVLARHLHTGMLCLDPFGGTGGGLSKLAAQTGARFVVNEIEWNVIANAAGTRRTNADALSLPFASASFDGIVTSPAYGNRMADTFTDDSRRNTYTSAFGFDLHPNNAGRIQWGARYCDLHRLAWGEAGRVLKPGGLFLLNISDHIRDFQLIPVAQWHRTTLAAMGLVERAAHNIETPRNRLGENHELRADCETVFVFEKP